MYRGRRPFHPERLMTFITEKLGTDDEEEGDEEDEEKEGRVEGEGDLPVVEAAGGNDTCISRTIFLIW